MNMTIFLHVFIFSLLLLYCFLCYMFFTLTLLRKAVQVIMLSNTSPYHFSRPAIYQMFVGRRTDKGMCLTLSITDNWTQYAVTSSYEVVTASFGQPGFNPPNIILLHLATFVWLCFTLISVYHCFCWKPFTNIWWNPCFNVCCNIAQLFIMFQFCHI